MIGIWNVSQGKADFEKPKEQYKLQNPLKIDFPFPKDHFRGWQDGNRDDEVWHVYWAIFQGLVENAGVTVIRRAHSVLSK